MEYGPDSEPNADVRFISSHIPVFTPEEISLPEGDCSLVATAPKFGRIFVACGTQIKVFESKTLFEGVSGVPLTSISVGAQVTHVACSCDGLTLLVVILHNQVPHALFYEIRSLVPGCGEQIPLVSVALAGAGGQVHGLTWNPMDPSSVALAISPSSLSLLTLKENQVEVKSENIQARALGWSPKGKQLTVGLEDGTLKLFKPDLTAVRAIQRPPMDEAGAVLSITWFTNTEFFIGYKSSVVEGAHVIMYVNAPKAKEPKFVAYEYICNDNQGPRAAMFYPFFFPEWSLLCLLSSRAVTMAVLGRSVEGGDGWCEYELDEGCVAAVQNISITEETFPLGLAVDFTSQKTFTAKDNKVSGPCPVMCTLSTGGELNLFHVVNEKSGAESLTKPQESLPASGVRTPQQFGGISSYSVGKPAVPSLASVAPETKTTFPAVPAPLVPSTPPAPQKLDTFSFSAPAQSSSPVSASPLPSLSTNFKLPQSQPSPLTTSLFAKTEPAFTPMFKLQGTSEMTKPTLAAPATIPKLPQATTTAQDFKFPSFPLSQLSTPAVTSSSTTLPDTKPQPPVVPKPLEVMAQSVATPARLPQPVVAELDDTLIAAINAAKTNFERELEDHMNMGDLPNQVGGPKEMGELRCSLGETAEWVDEMSSTTSELKGEVGQLHSEVLEGFILAEEAEAQVVKSKNPRHRLMLQPQTLDPHSRKQMEEIRSLYQYLQSQLAEIDTRLHLDWAAYRNEQNKKKKKELPASETLYQALKKCHYARKVCEQRVDSLCERIKDLHLHSLSGLAAPQTHQEDDEIMATLERSLRETSISTPHLSSPFKMLSPGKQESLQKVLSQRNFIPLRKCSNLPRMNLSSLEDLSLGHSQEGSPRSSFTANKGHSLLESFGPQTFSTPMRNNQTSVTPQAGCTSEASVIQGSKVAAAAPPPPPEPQYEDITPPQTPDNRLTQGTKPASPLRALSRLVSEVPTTGASETKAPGTVLLAENKTAFQGFGVGGSSSGGLKAPVTVTTGSLQGAFKPVTSAPLSKTTLAFSFTQFAPPTVASQGSVTQQPLSQNLAGSSSPLFKPPAATLENTSFLQAVSNEVSQKTEVKGSLFFKPPVPVSESYSPFSEKVETSVSSLDKVASTAASSTSKVQSVPEAAGNSSVLGAVSVPESFTTPHLASVAETESTSSSSSTDSDTASNATVIGDSVSTSGTPSFPEGSEQLAERIGDTAINKEASLPPMSSTSQPSLFSANSGSFFGGGSNNMFSGVSSSSSGFFANKTSVESGLLGSSSASTTTTTTPSAAAAAPTSGALFVTSTSGDFFASATSTAATGSVFNAPVTASSILFGAKSTASSSPVLLGTETTTTNTLTITVTSGSLFGKTSTATTTGNSLGTVPSASSGSIFGDTKTSSGGTVFGTSATTSASIFGGSSNAASGSIFGTASTGNGSLFGMSGSTGGSIFGTTTTAGTVAASTATTTTTTISATSTTTSTISSSSSSLTTAPPTMFGNSGISTSSVTILGATTTASDSSTATTTAISGLFGTASSTTTGNIFGTSTAAATTATNGTIFGVKTTAASIFGTTNTSGNLFATTTTAQTGSIFGTTSTSTSSGSIFGSASTSGSIFGSPVQTSGATPSIFGAAAAAAVASSTGNTSTLFGREGSGSPSTSSTSTTTTAASTSIPASSSASALTTGLFSSPPAGEATSFSLAFTPGGGSGSANPATSATPSLFSTQATSTATGVPFSPGGVFSGSSTTSTSAFTSLSTSSSAFTSPAVSSAPSLTPAATTAAASTANTVFGQSTPGLVFGGTAPQQNSLFGGGGQTTGTFGASSTPGSIFGGSTAGQSLFGNTSSGSVFGQTSAATTSPFASVSTSKAEASPFGGSSAFGSGGGGGGGFFSGLGSKPSAENANKNVFGAGTLSAAVPQTSLFGTSSSSSSPFQSSVFGGAANSGTGGGGSFSSGGGPVANTGFAVTTPQSPAFGGNPTFGGSPSFGGSPTFGSSPVFGGSSTFSSPLKNTPTGGGGGGFSSFASSGSATFGSLAGASPPSTGGFGSGSNFSSWR
ncbi:nuclear pore complex protein Nup214-like isoform X2 [Portunus trituberculatus]|uniref:nuclear pore complex protein Nup214-like isoform X2 n=1 Tax=Portunus trituberculatus TaxID=210409 RepID=UPI001E1CF7C3|nr:nuclear pore complex protein Nup214-like isoform X2 [Portunus trituberculatus]